MRANTGPAPARSWTSAAGELDAAVAAIRQVRGYADFMAAPTYEQIARAATPDAPLVYLITTPAGGLALIVRGGKADPEAVWLDGFDDAAVHELLEGSPDSAELAGYMGAYGAWRRNPGSQKAARDWFDVLDDAGRALWHAVMGPLVGHLAGLNPVAAAELVRQLPGAVLIPGGLLAFLPLHAAWTADEANPTARRYTLDCLAIRYAPSAAAAAASSAAAACIAPEGVLAVENPDGSLRFAGRRSKPLPPVSSQIAHAVLAGPGHRGGCEGEGCPLSGAALRHARRGGLDGAPGKLSAPGPQRLADAGRVPRDTPAWRRAWPSFPRARRASLASGCRTKWSGYQPGCCRPARPASSAPSGP